MAGQKSLSGKKSEVLFIAVAAMLLFSLSSSLFAQSTQKDTLTFLPMYGHQKVELNSACFFEGDSDSVIFETLKFYISGIEFLKNGERVWKEENSFHLMDAAKSQTMQIALSLPQDLIYDKLKFNLGIDSLTNVSGARGGDLDPTKGMYWAWQSGYINFKIEGTGKSAWGPKTDFQFHVGGYSDADNALATIELEIKQGNEIVIFMNLASFKFRAGIKKIWEVMSPGPEAVMLSKMMAQSFSILKK